MGDTSADPVVSVVIAAYNAAPLIRETLESILAQTYQDFELIVVDDGSTDETAAVVAEYGDATRYLYQENSGQPPARNAGIRAAQGRYIAFVDADDLWLPEKLERQMLLFEREPDLAWSYSDALFFDSASGKTVGVASQEWTLYDGHVFRPLLLGNFVPSPTPVIRRDVFEEVGDFNESPAVRNGEDWEMWLRIAARYRVGLVSEPLAKHRLHPTSMTQSMDLDYALNSRLQIVQGALRRHPEEAAGLQGQAVANVYETIGRWALDREERARAKRLFAQALRRSPASLSTWLFLAAALLPRPLLKLLGKVREQLRSLQRST